MSPVYLITDNISVVKLIICRKFIVPMTLNPKRHLKSSFLSKLNAALDDMTLQFLCIYLKTIAQT